MVLRDLDGGHVAAVSYDCNAPVERTLKSLRHQPQRQPVVRGHPQPGPRREGRSRPAAGQRRPAGQHDRHASSASRSSGTQVGKDATVEVELLNLWCADGLRSVKMSDVQRVRFLNPVLDSEFKKALETLALTHDTQKKAVSINFVGEGERHVKVGYVVENPIWKTSYRLVLAKDKEDKPYLQGWAVVENPTDEDWKDVRMALVAGRPISFQMDLYSPLFVKRPTVEPELFASLRPPTYSGDLARARRTAMPSKRTATCARLSSGLRRCGRRSGYARERKGKSRRCADDGRWPEGELQRVQAEMKRCSGRSSMNLQQGMSARRRARRSWATSSSTSSTSR